MQRQIERAEARAELRVQEERYKVNLEKERRRVMEERNRVSQRLIEMAGEARAEQRVQRERDIVYREKKRRRDVEERNRVLQADNERIKLCVWVVICSFLGCLLFHLIFGRNEAASSNAHYVRNVANDYPAYIHPIPDTFHRHSSYKEEESRYNLGIPSKLLKVNKFIFLYQ